MKYQTLMKAGDYRIFAGNLSNTDILDKILTYSLNEAPLLLSSADLMKFYVVKRQPKPGNFEQFTRYFHLKKSKIGI